MLDGVQVAAPANYFRFPTGMDRRNWGSRFVSPSTDAEFIGAIFWDATWDRALSDAEIPLLGAVVNPFALSTVEFEVDINQMIANNLKFGLTSSLRMEFGAGAFRALQFGEGYNK